jgi:hypothetical protein
MNDIKNSLPEFGIALRIESEPIPEKEDLFNLLLSVKECIDNLDLDAENKFERKQDATSVSYEDTLRIFRTKERMENTRHILQYLLLFLDDLPSPEQVKHLPVNPFLQFKEFVLYQIADLKENDVKMAVIREYRELGFLNASNSWIYEGKIRVFHDRLLEKMGKIDIPDREGYIAFFSILKDISLFWFGIRRENLDRIRKSDLYIYKLVRILLHRLYNSE